VRTTSLAIVLALAACDGDSPRTTCTAGSSRACSCADQGKGIQVCQPGGTAWGPCLGCPVSFDARPDLAAVGKEGGPCGPGDLCEAGLVCRVRDRICVRSTDASLPDARPDAAADKPPLQPDATADKPPLKPDAAGDKPPLKPDAGPCAGAIKDEVLAKGVGGTATSGADTLSYTLKDVDVSQPQVVMTLKENSAAPYDVILTKNVSEATSKFIITVVEVNNAALKARVCVTHK
jgi:hypothetical protein